MPRAATMRSNARQRSEEATVARYIGQCQVCEGDFKLLGGQLVHHGYKRPGHGEIVGDCPGVYEPPYEASSELVKLLLAKTEREAERADSSFEALKRDDFSELTTIKRKVAPELSLEEGEVKALPVPPLSRGMYLVTHSRTTTPVWLWRSLLKDKLGEAAREARMLKSEVEHLRLRVNDWELKPIRSVEEEVAKQRSGVAERKAAKEAVKSAAKAQKDTKLAAQESAREEKARKFIAKHEPELAAAKDYLVEVLKEYRQLPSRDSYAVRSAMWAKTKGLADLLKGLSPPIVDAVIDLAGLNKEVDELDIRRVSLGGSYDSFSSKRDRQ